MLKFVCKTMLLTLICTLFGTLFRGGALSHAAITWQQTNVPYGGSTIVYAIVPTANQTVYAGTDSGAFKSVNGGASWSAINTGLADTNVLSLAVAPPTQTSPQTIYAGTLSGVFKSVNGGTNWIATSTMPDLGFVGSIAIDPNNPETLYAGTFWSGVFKSIDGGANWNPVTENLEFAFMSPSVNSIAIDPSTPQTVYVGTLSYGVLKTVDGGANWIPIYNGLISSTVNSVAIDPSTPQTVYAGTFSDGVFKTVDGGANWVSVKTGLTTGAMVNFIAIDPAAPSILYAGTDSGVFKSDNGGTSWSVVNTGLTNSFIQSLAIDPTTPQVVYSGTNGGLFKSNNGCASWKAASAGLAGVSVDSLAIAPNSPQTLYAGLKEGGVFKSDNGGGSWNAVNTGLTTTSDIYALVIDPTDSQTVYSGTSSGVYKSVNGGMNWSAVSTGLTKTLAIDPITPQTIYAGTTGGVFKSVNGGASWSASSVGLTSTSVKSLAIDPTTPQTIYAGTSGGLFKSLNGGASWSVAYTGAKTDVLTIAVDPSDPQVIYAGINGGALVKSIDGGASWNILNTNSYSGFSAILIDPGSSQILYAVTSTILVSTDSGNSWSKFNPELTNIVINSLAIDSTADQALYAGTDVGVLKKYQTLPELTVSTLADGAYTNNATLNVSGVATDPENNVTVVVTVNGIAQTVPLGAGGTFGTAVALTSGVNTIKVDAASSGGSVSNGPRSVTYDPAAPMVVIATPADTGFINVSPITVSGTVSQNATVQCSVNGGTKQYATLDGTNFTCSVNPALGLNSISVDAVDLTLNHGNAHRSVTYDPNKPSVAITNPPQDIITALKSCVSIEGTVSDALTQVVSPLTLTVKDALTAQVVQTYHPVITNGAFKQAVCFIVAKQYLVEATAIDQASNSATATRRIIFSRGATLGLGTVSGARGKTVSIPVTLTNVAGLGLASVGGTITYDSALLESPTVTPGKAAQDATKDVVISNPDLTTVILSVAGFNVNPIADGVVAYLHFNIKSTASYGASTLRNNPSGADTSTDANDVNMIGTNGTVTVDAQPNDCNGDGTVSVAEIQSAINMYLQIRPVLPCVDLDGSGVVSIGEVQKVINAYLRLN